MVATSKIPEDILPVWLEYKKDQTNKSLRNQLMERYFPLVKYNGERIWQRLPEGVELDDLISAGVFGLMDAIDAFDLDSWCKIRNLLRSAVFVEPCWTNCGSMDWVPSAWYGPRPANWP